MRFLVFFLMLFASPAFAEPSVEIAFSPGGGATEAVVAAISEARASVHLAGYSFTSRPIADALIAVSQRGVDVDVVLDKSDVTDKHSEAAALAQAGVPVRIDYRYSIMHSKYIVIDGMTVETGSFNFTKAAELRNSENVIVLRDARDVAARYEENWRVLWGESEPYEAR